MYTYSSPNLESIQVADLTNEEQLLLDRCYDIWQNHQIKNQKRTRYYEQRNEDSFNYKIPNTQKNRIVKAVSCWAEKAVDSLAALSSFDGFIFAEEVEEDIDKIVKDNYLKLEYSKAVIAELIHGCSFLAVSAGDKAIGEPEAIVTAYSAEHGSVIWDNRKHRTVAGVMVTDTNPENASEVTGLNFYTEDSVIELAKIGSSWEVIRKPNRVGRCLLVTLMHKPGCGVNPLGKSRITNALMSLIDRAKTEMIDTAVSAAAYTSPQRYILGLDPENVEAVIQSYLYGGSTFVASYNKNGSVPTFGQLPQVSMQPHIDLMRQYASECAAITNLPVHSLGVIHDNPASAEAILCSMNDLITDAVNLNNSNSIAMRQIGLMILAIKQNKPIKALSKEELTIEPKFLNPAHPSLVTQADAVLKICSGIPGIANSSVILEELGFTEEQRIRLENDKKKEAANLAIDKYLENDKSLELPLPSKKEVNDEKEELAKEAEVVNNS